MKVIIKNKHLNLILVFIVITVGAFQTFGQRKNSKKSNGASDHKVILEGKLSADNLHIGDPIELVLTIKNKTDSTIELFDLSPERSFAMDLKFAGNLSLSLTPEGEKKKHPSVILHRETVDLEPGKEITLYQKVRLDEMFDLSQIGKYTLNIKRSYYLEKDNKLVTSISQHTTMTTLSFAIK